eukprot:TRINITY_DN264_c0_g4_i1.p1 TRINITY_DN264_c0_g4~~TRINITY_DN264_c0_g4_i1.p1  ORF type:complete len:1351 (-),score=213.95 TRINITY_DN264_c0_g4_i1:2678-6730(-)
MSGLLSAEKLQLLRGVTGAALPDRRLRAALARAAGDLDLAATRLLAELAAAPVALTVTSASTSHQVGPESNVGEKQVLEAHKHDLAHARRLAWRSFYCEQHERAVRETGGAKKDVDAFIVTLWKALGSKERQRFTNDVLRRIESEAGVVDHNLNAKHDGVGGDAVTAAATHTLREGIPHQDTCKSSIEVAEEQQSNSHAVKDRNVVVPVAAVQGTQQQNTNGAPPPRSAKAIDEQLSPVERKSEQLPPHPKSRPSRSVTPPPTSASVKPFPSFDKRPRVAQWPRELVTRSGRGIMLTRGRNLLRAGDRIQFNGPPARTKKAKEKKLPTRMVRFCKCGRELGRLAPDLAGAIAPALQSGFVVGEGKVLWAPKVIGMFTEILLEVSLFLKREAFDGNEGHVEAGLGDDSDGVDARRVSVVSMILDLKICEQKEQNTSPAAKVEDSEVREEALNGDDPGAVDESAAESYYKTVEKINEGEAAKYEPPRGLLCTLREYQKIGVLWMTAQENFGRRGRELAPTLINPLWKKCTFADGGVFYMNTTTGCLSLNSPVDSAGGPYGGILADEMGLGKTVQCIACILHDNEKERNAAGTKRCNKIVERKDGHVDAIENALSPSQKRPSSRKKCNDVEKDPGPQSAEVGERDEANSQMDVDGVQCNGYESQTAQPEEQSTEKSSHEEKNTHRTSVSNEDNRKQTGKLLNTRRSTLRSRVRQPKRLLQDVGDDGAVSFDSKSSKEEEEVEKCGSSDEDWMEVQRKKSEPVRKRRKKGEQVRSALFMLMATASKKKASLGGTLIVCPTSLVTQWINQLNQHVTPNFLRVTTHYGQGRGNARSISLLGADVVVTSYGTLAAECSENTSNGEEIGPRDGPLFKLQWRRIILDEAHSIKSRVTKWAKASYKIRAERRWCVTGTVIHNHVNDVFSLLHFLDVKPWSSWAFWNRVIVSNLESNNVALQKTAMSLIRDIISSVTLRRKKTTKDSHGNCIVQLTKKTVKLVELTPSSQERDFYTAIHQRSKLQFDTYLAQDRVMNNYASVLELLLRLRQACDHPYLVFAAAPSKDSVVMKDRDKLFKQFMEAGSSAEYVEKVFKDAESGAMGEASQCPLCLDIIDDPVAPKECGHPACRVCMMESLKRAFKCPVCRIAITRESVVTLPRKNRFSVDLNKKWRSSAKIDELLKDVRMRQELRQQSKGEGIGKTVIFSQFTSMLDLVGTALDRENFQWLRIDGSVPQAQRALILDKFEQESEFSKDAANILLVSLRAGGVGLNLVAASFAILLDIHWNPQVDAQAQDRIHRHGQTRDVLVKRYIIKDTVEEKLLQVQSRKQSIADGALEAVTDDDRKKAKLSELKLLFSTL